MGRTSFRARTMVTAETNKIKPAQKPAQKRYEPRAREKFRRFI